MAAGREEGTVCARSGGCIWSCVGVKAHPSVALQGSCGEVGWAQRALM